MARLRILLLALAISSIFCRLPANAVSPKALVAPITKDAKTLRYTVEILQKTPVQKQNLMLDLTSDYSIFRCSAKAYKSSTYSPVPYTETLCKSYEYSGSSICYSPTAPGCHNGTCVVPGLPNYELARDVASIRATSGSNPGGYVKASGVVFACTEETDTFRDYPSKATGLAGMTASSLALPAQLSASLGISREFAICLPSTANSPGALFFGSKPYVFLPPPGRDLSTRLITTPLLKNSFYTDDYYIGVRGIQVNGVDVAFNKSSLQFGYRERGGAKLDTLVPYTQLSSAIYNSLAKVFTDVAIKMNVTRAAANVAPFGTCFNTAGVASTRVGPAVPTIDLVLQNNATWRIFGANSMVQVSDKVMCLGFVDGGGDPVTTILIGAYQMEDNFLHFDLARSSLGFTSSLLFQQTTCSNFNFTSSK
ncbi:hypothetical protein SUGI_1122970 [Cryptomeria japonica]|uniref:probable aspartic proteinase GIP2 n=1 Tax=Cryptomeria japonica TaxID=3369 RepID=UPI0024149951|nr:probable aspartic proteinase GIP2 [Cryptomeria japonica]GLJ52734.1 hypothetical protein SUGI_1122970 [Cryptomeria japonica]